MGREKETPPSFQTGCEISRCRQRSGAAAIYTSVHPFAHTSLTHHEVTAKSQKDNMANTGPDPGPSTNPAAEDIAEPVFKKRAIKRGTVLRPRSISADPVGEAGTSDKDGANAAAKDTDAAQSEDQDEFG